MCVDLSLGFLFCSIDLYFCLCASTILSWFCDPMDYSPPGFSVHGISQAGILEWVAISSSRGPSWPRERNCISCIATRFFTTEPLGKPLPPIGLVYQVVIINSLIIWRKKFVKGWGLYMGGTSSYFVFRYLLLFKLSGHVYWDFVILRLICHL